MLTLVYEQITIQYEFRINRGIVIFLPVDDQRVTQFADMLHNDCKEIRSINIVNKYDSHKSAIIGEMRHGYNLLSANREIVRCFNSIFGRT